MPKLPAKKNITETQFEAQLRAAIVHAFPWLPSNQITHQDSFSFKFGHATVTVGAEAKSKARARADVLLSFKGKPLAIFELKRPGLKLSKDDDEQGLSYARMLHPRPPLVVISNAETTRILETETGELWKPATMSESTLAKLLERNVTVARADLKRAVDTLMGTDSNIWMQAVRQVTENAITELTGYWDEPLKPFVADLLLPRKVTVVAIHHLDKGERLIAIIGGPLSGKSSIMRELAKETADSQTTAVLYVDADIGMNLFEQISLILSDVLDWPVTQDEARQWLMNLSRTTGPSLVLAIDNLGPDRDDLRRNIETLTGNLFGLGLRVVVAVDNAVADQINLSRNGRTASVFGRRAIKLNVGPLDKDEFELTLAILAEHRLTFVKGAIHSAELRVPWLLRAITSDAVTDPKYQNHKLDAALSPVPGLEIIEHARRRFDITKRPFSRYRELAQAIIEDAQDATRPYKLQIELSNAFIVRRATALNHLNAQELQDNCSAGLIRESRSQSKENIYVILLPELMASELSILIAAKLITLVQDAPTKAVDWLVESASTLPLGDVIAAHALLKATVENHGLSIEIITGLRIRPPKKRQLMPGSKFAMSFDEETIVDVTQLEGGGIQIQHNGRSFDVEPDPNEPDASIVYEDVHPYLILSHLAGYAIEVLGTSHVPQPRLDPDLLMAVGGTPFVLRRPFVDFETNGIFVHNFDDDLAIVCHKTGIVEPITWSLVCFFGREDSAMRDQFIDEAANTTEPALLARMDIALRQIEQSSDKARAAWANDVRVHRIEPLLKNSVVGYLHA